ncbi:MAG: sensor histidine kinase [Thermoleophilia bacterium]
MKPGSPRKMISRVFGPLSMDEPESTLTRKQRYTYLQRLFIAVMTVAIILPLAVTSTLGFLQYRNLFSRETDDKLRLDAQSAKQSFEFHIQETLSTMVVVADGYEYGQLFNQTTLEDLFNRLRGEYSWVIDMGALDSSGVQRAYVGPYLFQGINYSDQEWYQNAYARKTYVSDIFTGYRGVPHFVTTVTNGTLGTDQYWMLRASIDATHLANYIATINTDAATDMFLVAPDGTLRTQSVNHGDMTVPLNLDLSSARGNITLVSGNDEGSRELTAFTKLEGMPWILVLERRGYVYGENWNQFQMQFILIVVACALVAIYIIFRVTRVMVTMIKNADRRRDQILAEAQNAAKLASVGQLAAGVAHEINNPLAIINEKIGLIRDLTKYSDEFPQRAKFLALTDGAAAAVKRCRDITHRLLGFARRMDVEKESLRVNEVIREVVSFVEKEALYRDIRLVLALDDELPAIQSDRGQLQQIFLNILNNAIDAVESDGTVTIRTSTGKPGRVRTTITDTGPGIPQNVMNHIFEPFFTTKNKNEYSGTGLGLSITYGIVKKLCGKISVESPPGKGATFIVDFPIDCDLGG